MSDPTPSKISLSVVTGDPIVALKPAVDDRTLTHKQLVRGPFWHRIPAYRDIDEKTFLDHHWQAKASITSPDKLLQGRLFSYPDTQRHRLGANYALIRAFSH